MTIDVVPDLWPAVSTAEAPRVQLASPCPSTVLSTTQGHDIDAIDALPGSSDELATGMEKALQKQISGGSDSSASSTTVHSIEELSSFGFFSQQCTEIDLMAIRATDECCIKEVLEAVVEGGQFCVSIADPKGRDVPLIAVSDGFETMTGYRREEVLGKNCRFLNIDCDVNLPDLVKLRMASRTGASFTGVLPNRRKSGELFLNLLDLRGLTVATNPATGEDLWYLVGIQADVTNLHSLGSRASSVREIHAVANDIRKAIAGELSALAVSAALVSEVEQINSAEELNMTNGTNGWCLLPSPIWRPEVDITGLPRDCTEEEKLLKLLRAWPSSDDGEFLASRKSAVHRDAGTAAMGVVAAANRCSLGCSRVGRDSGVRPPVGVILAATGLVTFLLVQFRKQGTQYCY